MHLPHFSQDLVNTLTVLADVCSTIASLAALIIAIQAHGGMKALKAKIASTI
jgi:hypothetical protein